MRIIDNISSQSCAIWQKAKCSPKWMLATARGVSFKIRYCSSVHDVLIIIPDSVNCLIPGTTTLPAVCVLMVAVYSHHSNN